MGKILVLGNLSRFFLTGIWLVWGDACLCLCVRVCAFSFSSLSDYVWFFFCANGLTYHIDPFYFSHCNSDWYRQVAISFEADSKMLPLSPIFFNGEEGTDQDPFINFNTRLYLYSREGRLVNWIDVSFVVPIQFSIDY